MKFILSDEIFEKAHEKFLEKKLLLLSIDPSLDVCQSGGTSAKGILTRGDLDLLIRTDTPEQLSRITESLKGKFEIKHPSLWNQEYSLFFEKDEFDIDYVLVLKESPYDKAQQKIKELLKDKNFCNEYNELKRKYSDTEYSEYSKAKREFLNRKGDYHPQEK